MGRVLITGGGGQLAADLEETLSEHSTVRAPSRAELDITDDAAVDRMFDDFQPEVVFNCAAFHNLGVCEREEDRAFEVNARAVKRIAERCTHDHSMLVHMSTNYVFDGSAEEPYKETDAPCPRSVYAISKLAGEHAALSYADRALVVRTAGLYGLRGSASKGGNFVTRTLTRARDEGQIAMVADQRLSPTFTADLAPALVQAADRGLRGILHLTNSGACSWFEFTQAIVDLAGIEVELSAIDTTRERGAPDRPLNGVLASAAERAGLAPLRPWRAALGDYMQRADLLAEPHPS